MHSRCCRNCYFGEICTSGNICNDYVPLDECEIDEEIDNQIEKARADFFVEWNTYITRWNT